MVNNLCASISTASRISKGALCGTQYLILAIRDVLSVAEGMWALCQGWSMRHEQRFALRF